MVIYSHGICFPDDGVKGVRILDPVFGIDPVHSAGYSAIEQLYILYINHIMVKRVYRQ